MSRAECIPVRTILIAVAVLIAPTTSSYATSITYNFAVRIDSKLGADPDLTLQSVQPGDVLHGTLTIDTSLPDLDGSPNVGQYLAISPSALSLTMGPYGAFPQETFSTADFQVRIAENGSGFFGNEELFIENTTPFVANATPISLFEIRLDSDSLSFLNGTGFPASVNLGLLNGNSRFEFTADAVTTFPGEALLGTITQFEVATDAVPEPASVVLFGSGLLALATRRRRRDVSI
jgi:PEP-CTERM motif